MEDKIALVTGGTSGVGLSIVKELAKNSYYVFFIGTNSNKGQIIESELNKANETRSKFIQLDLSDLFEVKRFVNQFKTENIKLDLLANVAGVVLPRRQETKLGFDKTFTIGYLSAFLLSNELIPLLERGNNSRIVNVSGAPAQVLKAKLDFNNLNFSKKYNGLKAAIATVHAKTVLTEILSAKLIGRGVDVNSFNPGIVKSDLTRNMPTILKYMAKIAYPFMANESKNGIYTSMSEKISGTTGKLFVNKKPFDLSFDNSYKEKLWTLTEQIIKGVK